MLRILDFTGGMFYVGKSQAFKSNYTKKVGALIIKGGNVFAKGFNRIQPHPKAYHQCSIHAEWDAIKQCAHTSGAKIFIYRFTRSDGSLAPSKPCFFCREYIRKANLARVYYVDTQFTICSTNFKTGKGLKKTSLDYVNRRVMEKSNGY